MATSVTAILSEKLAEGGERVDVDVSFAPAGTGAPTTVRGKGATVARTGVGTYEITFSNVYDRLASATATMQLASAADIVPQFGTFTAATSSASAKIELRLQAGATPTEVSADANNRVNCSFTFAKSSVTP